MLVGLQEHREVYIQNTEKNNSHGNRMTVITQMPCWREAFFKYKTMTKLQYGCS